MTTVPIVAVPRQREFRPALVCPSCDNRVPVSTVARVGREHLKSCPKCGHEMWWTLR